MTKTEKELKKEFTNDVIHTRWQNFLRCADNISHFLMSAIIQDVFRNFAYDMTTYFTSTGMSIHFFKDKFFNPA